MLKIYPAYKESAIPWINKVPTEWNINRGKALFSNPKEINKEGKYSNVLSLTLKGVIRNNIDNPIGLAPKSYDTYQLFEKDDLVFKLIDLENISTSRVGLVGEQGIMSSAYIRTVLRNKQKHNVKYFFYQYYSWYLRNVFNGLGGGVRQTINPDELLSLKILVPSRTEQDQIVRYLDWKVDEINRLVIQKKRQIKKLEELKIANIDRLITLGLNPNATLKSSDVEWIGSIPAHWKVEHIKQHFTIKKRIAGKEGYDVLSITQQGLKVKDISTNEGQMAQDYSGYQFVYPGEFAMNHMDLITGYVDLSDKFGVTSPDYRVFSLTDEENCYAPYYLRVFQIGYKRRIFYKFGKGAANQGRWRLPKRAFYDYMIQVPPIDEQIAIEKACTELEQRIDEMISGIRKEIALVDEYRTKLIADVVTGQIDVRDVVIPEYETVENGADEIIEEDDEDGNATEICE